MNKIKGCLQSNGGLIFCFLASALIAAAALNLGFKTEAGQIIPAELSMRSGDTNENIIRGIELAIEDINLIRSGASGEGLWRLLTFVHLDLFFYLALLLPETAAKTVLLIGYYIRFGLCCSAMYYFLSGHIKLSKLSSALLGAMYAFSSQIIFTAQFASVMNMAIMIPVLMSAFDSYLQKRTWKTFSAVCICSFLLAASGGYGILTGIPAMVFIGLLMCISLYKTFKMAASSWLKLVSGLLLGLIMDMAFAIPGLSSMENVVDIKTSFSEARVTYKVFDLIRGTFALRSGNVLSNGIPVFYVGILTLICVIVFAINEQIPVRLKVASALVVTVIHITCSSSFVNEMVSVFGTSSLLTASRLICIECILFLIAAIGIKNAKSLKREEFIAVCLIPMFFLIMSGVSSAGTTLATPILVATFFAIIGGSLYIYYSARDKISVRSGVVVLIAGYLLVGLNAAVIMFNNTITTASAEEYFEDSFATGTDNLILDSGMELPAVNNADTYLVVPADLSIYEMTESSVNNYNYLSQKTIGEDLFIEVPVLISDKTGIIHEAADVYRLSEGMNQMILEPYQISKGERLFIYSNFKSGATVGIHTELNDSERTFTGPFLTEIESYSGEVTLDFVLRSDGEERCCIGLYSLDETVLYKLQSMSGEIDSTTFNMKLTGRNLAAGVNTLILPYSFDEDLKVKIGGSVCDTFNFLGKMAVRFESGIADTVEVTLVRRNSGLLPGILISIITAVSIIAIPVIQRYNDKEKVTAEGNSSDA